MFAFETSAYMDPEQIQLMLIAYSSQNGVFKCFVWYRNYTGKIEASSTMIFIQERNISIYGRKKKWEHPPIIC